VAAIFALLLPVILAMSAIVIGIGNWFVHAKHLQTKADAGALAGGTAWQFPCGPAGVNAIDQRIADLARQYSGPTSTPPVASTGGYNPQVGGVVTANIHSVLNGPDWYDNDSNPTPSENLDFCDGSNTMHLDVKVTEDNSFPLASLIPLFPDIKRKAVVALEEAEGVAGVLPIAVRAPEPQSALAIFYDEANGNILDTKYLLKKTGPGGPGLPGLPVGLQGWSSEISLTDPRGWASVNVQRRTGVVIAISFRGACDTFAPPGAPPGITLQTQGACLEDGQGPGAPSYTTVGQLCNQIGSAQIAFCNYVDENTSYPNQVVISGLHFIRGYPPTGTTNGAPELGKASLSPGGCSGTGYGSGYFASFPNVCAAVMNASIDVGSCYRVVPLAGPCVPSGTPTAVETRIANNVEVKYTLVYGTQNNNDICDFGPTCDLADSGSGASYSATGPVDMSPAPDETRYAVGLRVRFKNTFVPGVPFCSNSNFNGQCEWYFTGTTRNLNNQPSDATFFDHPIQRIFRGDTVTAGSIRWLRLKADDAGCSSPPGDESFFDGTEGDHPESATSCFVVEMGMKGGLATDADEPGFLFSDGVGSSQMGYVDCTASGPQNIVDEIMNGCPPLYAPNNFDTTPFCPDANDLFTLPYPGYPGGPFGNGEWPPLRCVKTRPTGQGSDLVKGLNGRFFYPGSPNPSPQPPNTCPSQNGNLYTQGRNYWKHVVGGPPFGYQEDDGSWQTNFDPKDSRLVTIFLTTSQSFAASGQNVYPVVGAIAVYITGYGTVNGSGKNATLNPVDPCAGPPPADVDLRGGNAGGRVVWGHILKAAVLSANATGSGDPCNPEGSLQVCVPVLVQ
jgi:hypothetical protein